MIVVYTEEGADGALFGRVAQEAFAQLALSGQAAVELVFMDGGEMRALNARTRGIDRPTDVLSFPALTEIKPFTPENYPCDAAEGEIQLGSVVICREIAEAQAAEYGHSIEREYAYLFAHGLLHLLGYDHVEPDGERLMTRAAENILTALGIER